MDEDLMTWIAALRARVARGELAGIEPINLGRGDGTIPAELAAGIALADFDDADGRAPARRRAILADFRRLRERLG